MKYTLLLFAAVTLSGCGYICTCQDEVNQEGLSDWIATDPILANAVVNDKSNDVLRCLEIATGAELTDAEIDAVLPDEINSVCPDLANPNYQETE